MMEDEAVLGAIRRLEEEVGQAGGRSKCAPGNQGAVTVQVDLKRMMGELTIWPNGHFEYSLVDWEVGGDPTVVQRTFASVPEITSLVEEFWAAISVAEGALPTTSTKS